MIIVGVAGNVRMVLDGLQHFNAIVNVPFKIIVNVYRR